MSTPSTSEATPDLTKGYDPREVEARWYGFWEKLGVFEASDDPKDTRPVYVIPMPPPNVTGSLHMGHAMFCTLEDVLVRWHRMRGFNTLWQPGMDHAGIATQTVVERQLAREGITRQELGREAFEKKIWEWKQESGGRILEQQRVLGVSPDWKRSKFTMDPDLSEAVKEAFVRLYEEGLMYRATRLINWCPECRTALSDLEVDNEEGANGELFEFAYKVEGMPDVEIVVATTRPETMLGDAAVAVHPDDPRYKAFHGKKLIHPFVDRLVPVIADAILVDPKFGTGAVKVTPAHDFNDFATGKRHKLEEINIFTLDGKMNEACGQFAGLERKFARTAVKKALDEKGLARGSKPHQLNLPKCQRSGGVVEPMISTQWFLKMEGMAKKAIDAVKKGETVISPADWTKTYDHFLENIQDWCVSRQLWWGHQIPAWHGPDGQIKVARTRPPECGPEWTQDPDVLDTWFSSALWPFATQGWPQETNALKKFYPATDLETGSDILFFWVARMMMMGIHFMGKPPFKRVLLHGMVVDETGDKMSKVKGNVIDPLDLIFGATFKEVMTKTLPGAPEAEALAKFKKAYPSSASMGQGFPAFGADALRFTLATFPPTNRRIALAPKRIEGYRHFANKLWNATRLVTDTVGTVTMPNEAPKPKYLFNQWILSKLANAIRISNAGIDQFRIDEAANEIYRFFWTDYCDWYLEITKGVLRDGAPDEIAETKVTLLWVLETSFRLLHPIMPYISEELWQRIPKPATRKESVAFGPYPNETDAAVDAETDERVALLQAAIVAARTIRSEHEVHPAAKVPFEIHLPSGGGAAQVRALFEENRATIALLVKSERDFKIVESGAARLEASTVAVVPSKVGSVEVFVGLKGLVTKESHEARIERDLKRIDKDLQAIEKKMTSKGFVERAPKEVIDETLALKASLIDARSRIEASRDLVNEL